MPESVLVILAGRIYAHKKDDVTRYEAVEKKGSRSAVATFDRQFADKRAGSCRIPSRELMVATVDAKP